MGGTIRIMLKHEAPVTMACNNQPPSPERYIRLRQLIAEKYVPFSAPTLWRRVKDGSFPQPYKLSQGVTAWRQSDVVAWQRRHAASGLAE